MKPYHQNGKAHYCKIIIIKKKTLNTLGHIKYTVSHGNYKKKRHNDS